MPSKSIDDLQPIVRDQAKVFLTLAAQRGSPVKITQTLRTWDEQAALYAQGRTRPGAVVTKARPGSSMHNFGLAFDVAFAGPDPYLDALAKKDASAARAAWEKIGALGEECGLAWGGRWKSFQDRPHFEARHITLVEARRRWPSGWPAPVVG